MSNIILHIGHGKTGTSYIQSILASNIDFLSDAGIRYPENASISQAVLGKITSGNGDLIFKEGFAEEGTTLLSNENLFHQLSNDECLAKYVLSKCDDLHVVLFTRNVFEFLFSVPLSKNNFHSVSQIQ